MKDGTIMEQKAILRSFVKRIIINPPDVTLEYTAPLLEEKEIGRTTETAVLPMLQIGSPARTRTSDTLVNSQMLYQLSYRGTIIFKEQLHAAAADCPAICFTRGGVPPLDLLLAGSYRGV